MERMTRERRVTGCASRSALGAAVAVSLALAGSAPAADERPAWLAEAIAVGSTKEALPAYTAPGTTIEYTTPFRRVARAANKESRAGRTLKPEAVDPRAWVPELRVLVGALPVSAPGLPTIRAVPRSARLLVGAGEIKPSRMEPDARDQSLRAVFEVTGPPPAGAELEVRYAWTSGGRAQETVKRVALDFRKTRW